MRAEQDGQLILCKSGLPEGFSEKKLYQNPNFREQLGKGFCDYSR